jgi:hypothetical protein
MFHIEGDDVLEGGFEGGADKGLWNIFLMSILGFALAGGVAADRTDNAAVEVEAVGGTMDALEDMDGFH